VRMPLDRESGILGAKRAFLPGSLRSACETAERHRQMHPGCEKFITVVYTVKLRFIVRSGCQARWLHIGYNWSMLYWASVNDALTLGERRQMFLCAVSSLHSLHSPPPFVF